MESVLGPTLIGKNGPFNTNAITARYTLFYFSAHWCGPCRSFTPRLTKFYNFINKDIKRLEVIFISWDDEEVEYKEYFKTMPWLSSAFSIEINNGLG